MSARKTVGPPGVPPANYSPTRIVRAERVQVRRAGGVSWLVCLGCGRAGDIERDPAELLITGVKHDYDCTVAEVLWRSEIRSGLNDNGKPKKYPRPIRRTA